MAERDAKKVAGYMLCVKSSISHFSAGTAYEVYRYVGGNPIVCTNTDRPQKLPIKGASFEPYDPWARDHLRGEQ